MKQWELRGLWPREADEIRPRGAAADHLDPLRIVVNQVPALFWTTDRDLVVTSSLGADFDALGIAPNQLVGTALGDLFEAEPDGDLIEAHRQALDGSHVTFEAAWAHGDFRARVAPLRDAADHVIGTICVALRDAVVAAMEGRPVHLVTSA